MDCPRVFVIILNWNGKQDTLDCLKSLTQVKTPHRVIIVDNGSSDDSVAAIRSAYPVTTVLETGENFGYAEGNNVGIRFALNQGADFLLILNNDTLVDPLILENFLTIYRRHPFSILGGTPYLYSDPTKLDHLGGRWNLQKGQFDLIGWRKGEERVTLYPCSLDYVCGCALFSSAKVFRTVKEFDARFFLFWDETDWCFRAKRQGIQILSCPGATLRHKVSASFNGRKAYATYFWWRNRLLWIEKHCSKKERFLLFFYILPLELFRLARHKLLSLIKKVIAKSPTSDLKQQQKQWAALNGIKDYWLRRFYNGPTHLR